jgi:uncharacterized repeat protein (TIGR02543 family)
VKRPTLFLLTALFVAMTAPAAFALKYVAVVEVEIDATSGASDHLSYAEAREITAELRREAVKNLPAGKYNIMTSETVQAQGGAVLEECLEENCVITLGAKIGADYIVRGIVRKFKTLLTLSVEMYETEDGTLVASSEPVRSENAADLLMKTAAACANMYKTFVAAQSSTAKTPTTPATPVTYTVTTTANPANGGYVTRNPDKTAYDTGEKLTLTAAAYDGYEFTGWSGSSNSTKATLTAPIDRNLALTANFQYVQKPEKSEPKPQPVTPKPDAGITQNSTVKKRHTWTAVGLDAVGAGVLLYGYTRDMSVKDLVDKNLYADAETSASQRNTAYTLGALILLSGISVHIFF